jgi:hypothetical protein
MERICRNLVVLICLSASVRIYADTNDTIDEAEAKRRGVTVEQVQIEYLKKDNAELRSKVLQLQAENAALKTKLAAAASGDSANPNSATSQSTGAPQPLLHPLLDQPKSLSNLYARLAKSGSASVGFMSNPVRVGSNGLVESVMVEKIIDKTSMVASIRFPELKAIEMAPGVDYSNLSKETSFGSKAWQTGDAHVCLVGVDTTNLIDHQIFYLNEKLKVIGTKQVDGETIFAVGAK